MNKKLYFLAIIPPDEISAELTSFKKEAKNLYSSSHALNSPPHVTLVPPFWMGHILEAKLRKSIQELNMNKLEFEVHLNGFNYFEPNVLFVNIEESNSLLKCHESAKQCVEIIIEEPIKMNHPFHPHITVAFKDLSPALLKDAFLHFKEKAFYSQFAFENIRLLSYNDNAWEIIQ